MRSVQIWVLAACALIAANAQPMAQQPVAMPNAEKVVLLVRNTLITLNDAVQTGNFTVLRDTGAPGFREAHSAAQLSQIFSNLRAQTVDLSAVAVITPQLSEPPVLDRQKAMLRLKGYFPGEPVRIDFDLIYQAIEGRWRLFGLSVQPNRSAASAPQAPGNGDSTTFSKKRRPQAPD